MKLHKKILIALATIALLIPTSCSDDFLYVEPYDSVTNDLVFYSVDDFNVALSGVYSSLRSGDYYGKTFTVLPDIMTDNTYAKAGFTNTYGYPHNWIIQPGDYEYEGFFAAAYRVIVRASNIIHQAEGFVPTPNTPEENNRLKQIVGEAYLARAIAHFDLVRAFGPRFNAATASTDLGVPVVTAGEVGTPSRNTVAEVYTQIFADITQAKQRMVEPNSRYKFTPSIADALLSRIHLTRGEWALAASFADAVVANTSFSLLNTGPTLKNMFDTDGMGTAGNAEIIFHLVIASTTEVPAAIGTEYIGSQPGIRIAPNYLVTPEFANTFDRFNDIRFTSQLMKANVLLATPNASGGIICQKYIGNTTLFLQRGANSAKVFRIAEMYLNKAEAHAMIPGQEAQARAAIATLLTARIIGFNAASLDALTGQALIDFIRLERRKELAFEGHYWFDLKRWNLGFTRNSNNLANFPNPLTIDASDYRWQWPIPQHEMNANSNMRQNFGYY